MLKKNKKFKFIYFTLSVLFLGLCFCIPSYASVTTTATDSDYNDGYSDGYNDGYGNGYNDATENIVNNLQYYNAIDLYYNSSYLFISTDGGQTYSNTSGQNYSVTYSASNGCLVVSRDVPWNASALYYIDISFTTPIYLNTLRIPSENHPQTLSKVVVGDSQFTFSYDYVDGNPYMLTRNMLTGLTDSIQLYFGINSYTNGGERYFYIYIDGFVSGLDSYNNGYNDGVASSQVVIDNLNNNINVLKQRIESLNTDLSNNFGWQSLFFSMADTPFKTVFNMLGFDVFGINLFIAITSFLTLLGTFWLLKKILK